MQVSERVNALDCYGTETPANDPEKALEAAGADFNLRKVWQREKRSNNNKE